MLKRNHTRNHAATGSSSIGHFIRAELGFTQQELAWLLGVSRVALAKDEGDSRLLPSEPGRRLFDFSRLLHTLPPLPDQPPPPPDAAQREKLGRRLQAIRLAEYPVQQQLNRLHPYLRQLRRRQQAGPALQAALADTDRPRQFLEILLREGAGLLALDATAPLLLELRLRVLAFERAEIERLLNQA